MIIFHNKPCSLSVLNRLVASVWEK